MNIDDYGYSMNNRWIFHNQLQDEILLVAKKTKQ